MFHRPACPHDGTKTRRREARREVRNVLGVSSDEAPGLIAALRAVEQLQRIVDLASGGRYGLAVVRSLDVSESGQSVHADEDTWGTPVAHRSSRAHEPVSTTLRRERRLREENPELRWTDYL